MWEENKREKLRRGKHTSRMTEDGHEGSRENSVMCGGMGLNRAKADGRETRLKKKKASKEEEIKEIPDKSEAMT